MHELLISARFELRYHLRQPFFYSLIGLMLGQGAATGVSLFVPMADGRLWSNAPALLYVGLASIGPLLVAATALLTGQALLRDRDYHVGTYLYASPIGSRAYFSGQFLGTLAVSGLLGVAYTAGLLTTPLWLAAPTGPFPLWALLDGFGRLLIPNLLVVVCLSFALTALLRHIAGAYVALLSLTLGATLLQFGYALVVDLDWMHLLDPFGSLTIRQAMDEMTTFAKNEDLPEWPALLYINRLLWLGLSGWLLTRADQTLSFPYWLDASPLGIFRWLPTGPEGRLTTFPNVPTEPRPLRPQRHFSTWVRWRLVGRLAWADARWLVRQPAVGVGLLLLGLGIVSYALGFGDTPTGAPMGQRLLPFTSRMTFVRLPLHLYSCLFLVVFTGELVHRERTAGLWQLTDATPQPAWVMLLGKAGALLILATALTITILLTGLLIQAANGQTPIEWSLYARDLLSDGLLRYAQVIAITLLVQAVLPDRLVGHIVVLVGLAALTYLDSQTGGTATYLYTYLPGSARYSELTGYGVWANIRPVLAALWSMVALIGVLLAVRLAQRGQVVGPGRLLSRFGAGLTRPYVAALTLLTVIGVALAVWVNSRPRATEQLVTPYNTTTGQVRVGSKQINVQYHYVHAQNRAAIERAVVRALAGGSAYLSPFPHATLHITETPFFAGPTRPRPGQINLSERDGWMTDTTRPLDAGLLDMAVTKQVLQHWLVAKGTAHSGIPNGLTTDGLTTYLALRIVQTQRGDPWLTQQLAQLETVYRRGRGQQTGREPTAAEAPARSYVAEAGTPRSLTAIGEVWGHDRLCRQIGRFYQQSGWADAATYLNQLRQALPDSLQYLTSYLTERPVFDLSVGALGHYDDRLSVRVIATKWLDNGLGHDHETLLNDLMPIVLLDERGKIIHRQLIRVYTAGRDDKPFWLPRPKNATTVVVDPLGTFPETNRRNNRKLLVRL